MTLKTFLSNFSMMLAIASAIMAVVSLLLFVQSLSAVGIHGGIWPAGLYQAIPTGDRFNQSASFYLVNSSDWRFATSLGSFCVANTIIAFLAFALRISLKSPTPKGEP